VWVARIQFWAAAALRVTRDDDEMHTPRAQVDSNWYESSPGVWSSSNWEQEAEKASASAPVRTM
jgi:hypothetical protein